jgi:5'-phosphate synthase pdxT subunit
MIIGILALQGAFIEHKNILDKLGIENIFIKKAEQIQICDGIIIPGGESTAMSIINNTNSDIFEEIQKFSKQCKPVWGTCSGMILLANNIEGKIEGQKNIGGLDIIVQRNFFGSQQQSFIEDLSYPLEFCKEGKYPAIFIRAPVIKEVYNDTKILATCKNNIVAVQQNNILGSSFHPELSEDYSWHEYFINLVKNCETNKTITS